jgi:hypothetical protein
MICFNEGNMQNMYVPLKTCYIAQLLGMCTA